MASLTWCRIATTRLYATIAASINQSRDILILLRSSGNAAAVNIHIAPKKELEVCADGNAKPSPPGRVPQLVELNINFSR